MQSFDVSQLDELPLDGMLLPRIRMFDAEQPEINIEVEGKPYLYDRSYPVKGHSAVLPGQIRAALAEGKQPLIIERPERFYVYYQVSVKEPAAPRASGSSEEEPSATPDTDSAPEEAVAAANPESAQEEPATPASAELESEEPQASMASEDPEPAGSA